MKHFIIMLVSGALTLSAMAQTITITFSGTNKTRNYQVVLDGTSYYSNSNVTPGTNANVKKDIKLTDQQLGSHSIAVYRIRNNSAGTNASTTGNALYTNTFQLREGYDMNIKIAANGQVTFSEKRIRIRGNRGQQAISPMSDATFTQLLQSVNNQRLQSSKLTAVRNAFNNTSNYFTSTQVRQLLLPINTEANRLALAKLAYPRVTDPSNFTMIYDVFNRVASRDDMNAFIRNNPNNSNSTYSGGVGNNNNNNSNTYKTPVADYQFNQLVQNVNAQWSQSGKFNAVRDAFNTTVNYYSTSQIRQLLSLITAENDRLTLAKLAYLRVTDPASFTSLYDLFYNQSSKTDLNTYVIQMGGTGTNTTTSTRVAMSDDTFAQVLKDAANHIFPWDVTRDVKAAFNNTSYYFSTTQIRQLLSLVSSQSDRLESAKLAWRTVTDPANFTSLYDLFTTQERKDELNNYIKANPLQ